MWWGAPSDPNKLPDVIDIALPDNAVDYRNEGVPREWKDRVRIKEAAFLSEDMKVKDDVSAQDLNDRGRGRTVETQGGGLSLLRALWELVDTKE